MNILLLHIPHWELVTTWHRPSDSKSSYFLNSSSIVSPVAGQCTESILWCTKSPGNLKATIVICILNWSCSSRTIVKFRDKFAKHLSKYNTDHLGSKKVIRHFPSFHRSARRKIGPPAWNGSWGRHVGHFSTQLSRVGHCQGLNGGLGVSSWNIIKKFSEMQWNIRKNRVVLAIRWSMDPGWLIVHLLLFKRSSPLPFYSSLLFLFLIASETSQITLSKSTIGARLFYCTSDYLPDSLPFIVISTSAPPLRLRIISRWPHSPSLLISPSPSPSYSQPNTLDISIWTSAYKRTFSAFIPPPWVAPSEESRLMWVPLSAWR